MTAFTKYPGVGVKTASCVMLFCMRRPSFAVDTHIYRLCKWLGWVPSTASRDETFSHCEVRIPDRLKYPLHQQLIAHGRTCGRCRAATGEGGEGWDSVDCPINDIVVRTGKRKVVNPMNKRKSIGKSNKFKRINSNEDEDDFEKELTD